jgi:predicted ribonuclease YlaK
VQNLLDQKITLNFRGNLMPRGRKRGNPESQVGVGLTPKQLRRKKPISLDLLKDIYPLTDNQERLFTLYDDDKSLVAYGAAGTGKTFITIYNALCDVLDDRTPYEKIYLVRSLVPTREIGFLPGTHDDKADLYQIPYKNMMKAMFDVPDEAAQEMLYSNLKTQGTISFWSTSFIRGTTFENAIIIVDEFQNLNFHELDSIITRVGKDAKIMFCGDTKQSDLIKQYEKCGIHDFMRILQVMPSVEMIHFEIEDIVRSGFVKEYLTKKTELDL